MPCTGLYRCGFMTRMKLVLDLVFYRNVGVRLQLRQKKIGSEKVIDSVVGWGTAARTNGRSPPGLA